MGSRLISIWISILSMTLILVAMQDFEMCQLADFIGKEEATLDKVSPKLIKHFAELLGYNVTNL